MKLRTPIRALSFIALLSQSVAFAQTPQPAMMTVLPPMIAQAGEYKFNQYDQGKLQSNYLDILSQRQETDAKYVQQVVASINSALSDFIQTEVMGENGLQALSNVSVVGGSGGKLEPITAQAYAAAVQRYDQAILVITNLIESISNIPSAIQTQSQVEAHDSGLGSLPAPLQGVNFGPLKKHYLDQLIAIQSKVEALKFRVSIPNKGIHEISGTKAEIQAAFSAEQLNEMRMEIGRLRAGSAAADKLIEQLNTFIRSNINVVKQVFGDNEAYRIRLNQAGTETRKNEIADMFWARSALRLLYGKPLGGIVVNYRKQMLNWDWLTSTNQIDWLSETVYEQAELTKFEDMIYTAMVTQQSRSKEIFSWETGLLNGINSTIAWIRGESPLTEINAFVLGLLHADVQEEIALSQYGLRKVRDMYRSRYLSTPEAKAYYISKLDTYFAEGEPDDGFGSGMIANTTDTNTFFGVFNVAKIGLANYEAYFSQAAELEDALAKLEANNKLKNERNRRTNAIRNL